jgi:hypothetical protein
MVQGTVQKKTTYREIYGEANLLYIRYDALVEVKSNGQKKIGGTRPASSKIESQAHYGKGSGSY